MKNKIINKRIFVSGATGNIGSIVSHDLSKKFNLILHSKNKNKLKKLYNELENKQNHQICNLCPIMLRQDLHF